jgi:26S proteasome regulatory subunit N1
MLMTVNEEDGELVPVPVRVGQAVDVVAQAGRPKAVTGFQTHTTPVLLSAGDRAELGTERYVALSSTLEGVVVLRKTLTMWSRRTNKNEI